MSKAITYDKSKKGPRTVHKPAGTKLLKRFAKAGLRAPRGW
jgi:hypothetical protein